MAKQILVGIEEQNLNEVAHYLVIYFPYNEEMCSSIQMIGLVSYMKTSILWFLKGCGLA